MRIIFILLKKNATNGTRRVLIHLIEHQCFVNFCQIKTAGLSPGKKVNRAPRKLVQCNCEKRRISATGSFLFAFEEETEWLSGRWLVVSFLHVDGDPCNVFLFGQELTRGGRSEVFNCSHVTLVVA